MCLSYTKLTDPLIHAPHTCIFFMSKRKLMATADVAEIGVTQMLDGQREHKHQEVDLKIARNILKAV